MIAQYDLFKRKERGRRICFVQSSGRKGRHRRKGQDASSAVDSFGARAIRAELTEQCDIVPVDKIADYDIALVSITSVYESENLLVDIAAAKRGKGDATVIAGGMGMLNVWPLYDWLDVAVFGRAEGQVNGIVQGESYPNVWRKIADPELAGSYEIRQATELLPGEKGIGCPGKCSYCQYTNIRRPLVSRGYKAGAVDNVYEDIWSLLKLKSGRNISAWDGMTEATRRRVCKPVTDSGIVRKLQAHRALGLTRTTNIKTYNIIGYPWETPTTYVADLAEMRSVIAKADGPGSRILIMMLFTPFSPEPFTPMQNENVEFHNWREIIEAEGRAVYKGEAIEAFILPQIAGPLTLQKRVALNRCGRDNRKEIGRFVRSAVTATPDFYRRFGFEEFGGYGYLSVGNREGS